MLAASPLGPAEHGLVPNRRRCRRLGVRFAAPLVVCAGIALVAGGGPSLAISAARVGPSFAKPQRYPTAKLLDYRLGSVAVAVGDLNGDGRQDLAAAGAPATSGKVSGISVFLNRGHGRFRAARPYHTGWDPSSIAVADVNGDDIDDVITANGEHVSVLINRGGGRFLRSVQYAARQPWDVAIGDVNGDGNPELVTANGWPNLNTISVYVNHGDGRFQSRVDYRTGRRPISVAVADLNGDGKLDVATANLRNTVSVLLNRGDGTFSRRVDYRAPQHPRSIAIGDMNGDLALDLVTGNTAGYTAPRPDSVSVFLNAGDGTFRASRDHRAKGRSSFGPVAIGDLTGDGKHDVAVGQDLGDGDKPRRVAVLVGRGDGGFARRIDYPTGPSIADAWAPRGIALGRLNGDAKLDIVAAKFSAVAVLLNTTRR